MAYTFHKETSNGVQTLYSLRFAYLDKADVYVYAGGDESWQTQLSYEWADDNTIRLTDLSEVPNGTKFTIRRIMTRESLVQTFKNRSIRGDAVDNENYHALYLAQEVMDGFSDTGGIISLINDLHANNYRILDLPEPVLQSEPATKKFVEELVSLAQGVDNGLLPEVRATGSTQARALHDRFADVCNVKDFGAVGDGVTDDTAAIQAAFDSGRNIKFPPGRYKVCGILLLRSNCSVSGEYAIIQLVGDSYIQFEGSTENVHLSHLRIASSSTTARLLNHSSFGGSGTLTNVSMTECTLVGGYFGVSSYSSQNIKIAQCSFLQVLNTAINLRYANGSITQGCLFQGDDNGDSMLHAVDISGGDLVGHRNIVDACVMDRTGDSAIFMRSYTNGLTEEQIVSDCTFFDCGKAAIKFTVPAGHPNTTVQSCIASGNVVRGYSKYISSGALEAFGSTGEEASSECRNIIFANNVVEQLDGYTLGTATNFNDITNIICTNNVLDNAEGVALRAYLCKNVVMTGNTITRAGRGGAGGTEDAAVLLTSCENVVLDNVVEDTRNGFHGLTLNKCRGVTVRGAMSDITGECIYLSASGSTAARTQKVAITGMTFRNYAQDDPIHFAGFIDDVTETGCVDDSGPRDAGNYARRDAMSAGWYERNFVGRTFWNTTASRLEVWSRGRWLPVQLILSEDLVVSNKTVTWDVSDANYRTLSLDFNNELGAVYLINLTYSAGATGGSVRVLLSGVTEDFLVSDGTDVLQAIITAPATSAGLVSIQQNTGAAKVTGTTTVSVYRINNV